MLVHTTPEYPLRGADLVGDEEESSIVVAVVTGEPSPPVLDLQVEVEVEWVVGVAATSVHLVLEARTKKQRVRDLEHVTVRIGLSITLPEQETAVKHAARAQSMKKSLRDGGNGALKLAVRLEAVTLVTRIKKSTTNPTPRTVQRMSVPRETSLRRNLRFLRPEFLLPEECPLGGAGVEEVEVEMCTGAVAALEDKLGDTGSDTAQVLMLGIQSPQLQVANSKVHLHPLDPKIRVEEGLQEKRRTR